MLRVRAWYRRGQGTLEYILVLVIILLAIIGGSGTIKSTIQTDLFSNVKTKISNAANKLNN